MRVLVAASLAAVAFAAGAGNNVEDQVMSDAGVQGALLLSAALPDHGPTPTPETEAEMDKASQLTYKAYQLLQSASSTAEEAKEQMQTKERLTAAASNIASGLSLMQRGSEALKQAKKLQMKAQGELNQLAEKDPLGPPPEAPKSWARVEDMTRRASSRERSLRTVISDLQHQARRAGLKEVKASSAKAAEAQTQAAFKADDDKILAFLSKY
eukprot:TRINITY_DN7705_c0_g1_i2.p1 TRINITY_DN7705_c0_g1~~TRINITY_DN7705_c0_g1_i2.p1  ORF type:complete len:212 (-),score=77.27 TRINITY_DN7705_c0_g1_i2:38-673(-)